MNNLLKYALAGSIGLGSFALVISAPRTAKNLKPLKNERMQESELFSVFTDKETGDMYGYIEGAGGEQRFVKYDKNSENKVRQEKINEERALARQEALAREQAKAPTRPVVVSVNKNDVRSGEIFSVDDKWKDFEINTRIKYRRLEDAMLYRLAIKAPVKTINEGKSPDCRFSSQKEKELENLVANQDNTVRLRFKDSDDFWVQDYIIPLGTEKAGDKITTAIDGYYRDDCDKKNKLVFHGQIKDLDLPGFSWVDDGKLLFKGVKLTKPDDDKKDN